MEETKPKPFVFVLMPFSEEFKDVYEVGIKPACKDAGAYCERVDEQFFEDDIVARIYNQIAKADVIVSEMTGQNPNVFYETGYAHALNKRTILLTREASDIPFDLKHYPHIVHGGSITTLKAQLETRVSWYIENPPDSSSRIVTELQVSVPRVNYIYSADAGFCRSIVIDIHNPSRRVITSDSYNLALITEQPHNFVLSPNDNHSAQLPDGRHLYNLVWDFKLFPGGWASKLFNLRPVSVDFRQERMVLRVFTELGTTDYPFEVVESHSL